MSAWLWFAVFLVVFLALLYLSPRIRKSVFITATYVSLTGWYYYRKWEKRHGGGSPRAKKRPSKRKPSQSEEDPDVIFFQSADKLQQQEKVDLRPSFAVSEHSHRLSGSSSSSVMSEDLTTRPSSAPHHGLLSGLRRSKRVQKRQSHSNTSVSELLASEASEDATMTTRRTYSGRKKPPSWGE
ncbi:hypothetical protein Poli38472_001063 [Pythium oligandrum]|uniref:Uncharacterized protein n=1 Tax=Pythium oligandrum TaxID=41045 RepID=A0A8K1CU72_PYTOL|nr:hypothetical protein Poli38472_001063 [Pythium oligandrum]|eukprot:TMW68907.1 hypothetical protein Poli38472_001063 [Pythium oligandrum]